MWMWQQSQRTVCFEKHGTLGELHVQETFVNQGETVWLEIIKQRGKGGDMVYKPYQWFGALLKEWLEAVEGV